MIAKRFWSFVRALMGRSRLEDDMDAELRFHIQSYEEDLIREGVPVAEAARKARLEFGNVQRAKEECRESRGLRLTDELARNVRYASRMLRKSPGFALAAVFTLALCIGANTAIFSVIDAALLRPLPYPEPDRLMQVVTRVSGRTGELTSPSQDGATWEMLRDEAQSADLAASGPGWTGVNLATGGAARYVQQSRVTSGYFRVVGVQPMLGREFVEEEDREGGPPAVILSHALWIGLFGGNREVVGQRLLLRGEPHEVVGVMPAGFRPIVEAEVWTPLRPSRRGEGGGTNYRLFARLRPGYSAAQADSEIRGLGQRIVEQRRSDWDRTARFEVEPLQDGLARDIRRPLLIVWAAVGVVLLIGCVNVAGLLLVRASARSREMATRMALGGGRGAVVRQLLTESLVLAIAGGALSVGFAYAAIQGLAVFAERYLGVWQELRLDWRVLLMTLAVSVATSVLFGLAPAVRAMRVDVLAGLSESGGRGIAGGGSPWLRRSLVMVEIALGVVLLIGAGLLIRTLVHLRSLPAGFDGTNVVTASLSLQDARYKETGRAQRLFRDSLDRIAALPGVEAAAVGLSLPYERWLNVGFRRVRDVGTEADPTITNMSYVSSEYFRVLRIALVDGRGFDQRDTETSAPVAIVSRAFAEQYLKGEPAVGSRVSVEGETREIVGVVGDLQQRPGWGENRPLVRQPVLYIPLEQTSPEFMSLVHTWFSPKWLVRASGAREGLITGMQRAVEQTDPLLPFASFKTLDEVRDLTLGTQRMQAILLGCLAALALLLSAIGIYGLVSNSVARRTRELGIRMALGASGRSVMASVAREGIVLAALGIAAGYALSAVVVRVLNTAVYGVSVLDPGTFAAVGALLLGVAALASTIPALRIARLNPASTLRDE